LHGYSLKSEEPIDVLRVANDPRKTPREFDFVREEGLYKNG
jgi:hypothetical protein